MEKDIFVDAVELICKNQKICLCKKAKRIISIVSSNFSNYHLSLTYIKKEIGLGDTQIYEYCKMRLQTTPGNLISYIRLFNCLKQLRYTDESIGNICVNCGYINMRTFRNNIYKAFNVSPTVLMDDIRFSPSRSKNHTHYIDILFKKYFFNKVK